MADYNKQTVAQLRQLLKDRGIPSTGLTRKAQIVEKLEEADSADVGAPEASDAPADAAAMRRDNGPDRFPTLLGCKAARVHKAFDTLSCRLTSCVQVSHTKESLPKLRRSRLQ